MGFETFAVATREQPELVQALFARVSDLIVGMFERMAGMDWVGALWYSDDIAFSSGLMVSPDFLHQHLFPRLRKIGELAKERGIPFIYHSDGNLWDVLDAVIACGVTALHPLEPKSMDIVEVKRQYGHILGVCGGVDLDVLARGTPDIVRALVRRFLSTVAPGGGWCAGSSNSIPDYVPVENYLAMVDTVLEFGVYS
jgi:uroporphyrinogen decarboxylase